MKQNKLLRRLLAALLVVMLTLCSTLPALGAEDDEEAPASAAVEAAAAADETDSLPEDTISISTADDLLAFAASCTLDSWSQGKTVSLEADLDLSGLDFVPIATFGGTFNGNGHTISGLSITGAYSPAGLICTLQSSGVVRNLTVEGTVAPSGDCVSVGGIVGENYGTISACVFRGSVSGSHNTGAIVGENKASGRLSSCRASGTVDGENRTGGIAGCNLGLVSACRNSSYVNIESVDPGLNLDNLNLSFSFDLSKLSDLSTANVATDTGGIVGYSSGTVLGCANDATIGYPHIGYNVGGIVGRTSGRVDACVNSGSVYGRKDVGGIAGQLEPYVEMDLKETDVKKLQTQLNELSALVDKAASDAEGSSASVSARLNTLSGYVDTAVAEANNVRLNANVNTVVRGSGTADRNTTGSFTELPDVTLPDGSLGNITVTPNGDGDSTGENKASVSVDVNANGGTISFDGPLTGQVTTNGSASGGLDAATDIIGAPDFGGLTSAMNGITSQVTLLSGALNGAVGSVASDVRAINKKCSEISETLFDAYDNLQTDDRVTDASELDVDAIALGKLTDSRNDASVNGDINTGGIAGSMAFEYSLDPEDDVSSDLSGSYKRQYTYRAVVLRCVNTGAVTGKRSNVGGITGRMDLGLITNCEGYGTITSESGSYVGGIAGLTGATIRTSFAKCALSGKTYVGGIVGSGVAETIDGGGSSVSGCYSLVDITDCEQYSGAVSGSADGTFTENRFVSDTLAGLGQRSITGSAEPIDFETLSAVDKLPRSMTAFTLCFLADDVVVSSQSFQYGASFGEDSFPEIPPKDGCYAAWDRTDLENLHFDATVTAVYTPFTTALASDAAREDGRPVLLAEGDYTNQASITATAEAQTPAAFHVRSGSLGNRISAYFESWKSGKLPPMSANWEVVDQWTVAIDSDADAPYRVRYLPPEGKASRLRIYVEQDGVWQSVDYETIGSYLAFEIPSDTAHIAAVSTMPVWWIWVAVPLLLAVLIFLAVHFLRKAVRKRKPAAPENAPAAVAVGAPAEQAAPSDSNGNDALLARALSAEERLARVEAELEQLRARQSNPASAQNSPTSQPENPRPKAEAVGTAARPKRHRWLLPLILAAVLVIAAVVFFLSSGARSSLKAYHLLKDYIDQPSISFQADLSVSLERASVDTEFTVLRTTQSDPAYLVLTTDGVTLYCVNNAIYLENGASYPIGGEIFNYDDLLTEAVQVYQLVDLEAETSGSATTWRATAGQDQSAALAKLLAPALQEAAPRAVQLSLTAQDGVLSALCFHAETADGASLDLTLTPLNGDVSVPALPETVRSAVADGAPTADSTLTDDLFRLIRVFGSTLGQDTFSADLGLDADCGPVSLHTTLRYDQQRGDAQTIGCLQKDSLAVYFTDGKLCDASGNTLSADSNDWIDAAQLPALAYQLLLRGDASCTVSGSEYTYSLTLDADAMETIAHTIAPATRQQQITFTDGTLRAVLTDDSLVSLHLSCSGSVTILLTSAPVAIRADITPASRTFTIPEAVFHALKN